MKSKTTTTRYTLDPKRPPKLTAAQARRLDAGKPDFSDIEKLPVGFWRKNKPAPVDTKAQLTLRLDRDVLDYFRASGPRYQTRINAVLKAYVDAHR
jgi:uncharacterized protein (DUF4415 family)